MLLLDLKNVKKAKEIKSEHFGLFGNCGSFCLFSGTESDSSILHMPCSSKGGTRERATHGCIAPLVEGLGNRKGNAEPTSKK